MNRSLKWLCVVSLFPLSMMHICYKFDAGKKTCMLCSFIFKYSHFILNFTLNHTYSFNTPQVPLHHPSSSM